NEPVGGERDQAAGQGPGHRASLRHVGEIVSQAIPDRNKEHSEKKQESGNPCLDEERYDVAVDRTIENVPARYETVPGYRIRFEERNRHRPLNVPRLRAGRLDAAPEDSVVRFGPDNDQSD